MNRASLKEDEITQGLFNQFSNRAEKDFFNKEQFLKILKWKSPRPYKFYSKNSEEDVISVTKEAFNQPNEKLKLHILTALQGVNYPSASAILMFNCQSFPVLDIRVWQQLFQLGYLKTNEKGQNFNLNEWSEYLVVIREIAKEYKLTARQVEKALFDYHKLNQTGRLY
jgi:hypothetical protein